MICDDVADLLNDRNPLPLIAEWIDTDWYARQLRFMGLRAIASPLAPEDAARHYLDTGAALGLTPHPFLSVRYYLRRYPDVQASGMDPFFHFIVHGAAEDRSSHPLLRPLSDHRALKTLDGPALLATRFFDADFYRDTVLGAGDADTDPLRHYLAIGCLNRRTPHPLFDPAYYDRHDALGGELDLLVHYLVAGAERGADPHPLFATRYAADRLGVAPPDALNAFIENPWPRSDPHPLFDIDHYRRQVSGGFGRTRNPLIHYLTDPSARDLSPHILFDPVHYAAQLAEPADMPLLVHYLLSGWRKGLQPHILFDPASFEASCGIRPGGSSEPPLLAYLARSHETSPHYLFDTKHYTRQRGWTEGTPLADYLGRDGRDWLSPHPLFSGEVYRLSIARRRNLVRSMHGSARAATAMAKFGEAEVLRDPLRHYLVHGWREGLSPHLAFDPQFYVAQTGAGGGDPLAHYLRDGGKERFSPCPGFDLHAYLERVPECDPSAVIPYMHFLEIDPERRPVTNTLLDPAYYVARHADVRGAGVDPIQHFIEYGVIEGRSPSRYFSPVYVTRTAATPFLESESATAYYLRCRARRPAILFVGHDATRSGAPLILLKLIEALGRRLDCECYTLLARGGALEAEFARVSHVIVAERLDDGTPDAPVPDRGAALERALSIVGADRVVLGVCNTVETSDFARGLAARAIPVVSLIHEPPETHDRARFQESFAASASVVLPSEYARLKLQAALGLRPKRLLVRGQGLLDPYFGRGDRAAAREKVRRTLGLKADAPIVLGCGSADRRKGTDLFVEAAIHTAAVRPDIVFVWLGVDYRGYDSATYYGERRLRLAGAEANFRFVESQGNPEDHYLAADLMLLTSRLDPFPCVVHEAMAAGLPIVAFEGCSGAVEALGELADLVPESDVAAMVDRVLGLIDAPDTRRTWGVAAAERVARVWRFADYAEDMLTEIEQATGLDLPRLAADATPVASDGVGNGGERVFFLQPDWSISGVNTFTENLITGLRDRGMDARLLFTRGRYTPFEEGHRPVSPATAIEPVIDRPDHVWPALLDFLKANRPCVVIPNYDYVGSGIAAVLPPGVGMIGIAHSDDVEHYEHVYRLGLYWDRIIGVSRRITAEIEALNPRFAEKMEMIRYGVRFDANDAAALIDARDARAATHGAAAPLRIVYTGRLTSRQKRILDFVTLSHKLQAADVPFTLTLVGDGEDAPLLAARMSGLIDAGVVRMVGRRTADEIQDILAESDVFVLLSDFEGLPLSMLEAMGQGVVPVIRNMESGVREVLEDGVSGFITDRHSLDDMVRILGRLQRDPALRRTVATATVAAMRRHRLSIDDMSDSYAAAIREAFSTIWSRHYRAPAPLSYNAPYPGMSVPPILYARYPDVTSAEII